MISKKDNNVLLDTLIKYVLPIFNKKEKKKQSKLEELVKEDKTKLKPLELIFIEDLINSFLKDNKEIKKLKKIKIPDFLEIEENNKNNESEIKYSIALERKKEPSEIAYSVEIKYEET